MDKRLARASQPDLRKQDATASKVWPRSSKKRESNTNAPPKDVARKPPSQRGKSYDKRPRPRGAYNGSAACGKTNSGLNENDAEVGSIFLPGSKKQNLNHLLNFHYAPRDSSHHPNGGRGGRKHHGLVYTNTHKHNKELFLQSNCQFVVKSNGDYIQHLIDPDIPICWDLIEQINVRVNEPLCCPICLGETIAGHITRCGHTYCWPCLLHYFALSEDSTRPCPICFQPISKIHLKSVQGIWQDYVPVGKEITMKLMRRLRGNTVLEVAPPLDAHVDDTMNYFEKLPSVSEIESNTLFSKLLAASPLDVSTIISRERKELNDQLSPELEHPEFILEALHLLQQREDTLFNASTAPSLDKDDVHIDNTEERPLDEQEVFQFEEIPEGDSITSTELNTTTTEPINEQKKDKYFYFYQAADGQATFLHTINIRMLEATWGSLNTAPREITGIILERASGSVGIESRRRLRYLQHLTIHCPYDLVEIQLQPPFVTYETMKAFKGDLEDRKRQRQRKNREEKRREKVILQKEHVIMGKIPELELNINSEEHFPAYQPDIDLASPSNDWKWEKESNDSSPGPSSFSSQGNGLSFAKMASGSGTWGVRHIPPPAIVPDHTESDDDEISAAPPTYNLSDAITEALLSTSLNSPEEKISGPEGKKKKKFKPKVLFATGMQHRNA